MSPTKFSEIIKPDKHVGQCTHCGTGRVAGAVAIEVIQRESINGNGKSKTRLVGRTQRNLCEECAVGLYMEFLAKLHEYAGH